LYENETSAIADLVIPAKNFLAKNDIRTSYSHNGMMIMKKQIESEVGISVYELASFLAQHYGIDLPPEEVLIERFANHAVTKIDGTFQVEKREDIPYQGGFDTDDGEFVFLEEYEKRTYDEDALFLITPKSPKSLNSQFYREKYIYLNSSHPFQEGDMIDIFFSVKL